MSNGDGEKRRGRGDALLPLEADLEVVVLCDHAVQVVDHRVGLVLGQLEDAAREAADDATQVSVW